jgi:glycine/D-amino acid oxidase-like deaminating enzyme
MAGNLSIWEKETFFAHQDLVIIGSGFVGLWSALLAKKSNPKLKIKVLERGLIPTGASTRNAGFACFGSLSELMYDGETMGTDAMLEVAEMRFKGLERIQSFFSEKKIDFSLCGGYELYEKDVVTPEKLEDNIQYLNTLLKPVTGAKKTYRLTDEKLAQFGFGQTAHLVENKLEGYLHSGKLLRALLQKVQGLGVTVLNGIEVKNIVSDNNKVEIECGNTAPFTATRVLLCTNAFTKQLLPEIDIVPARGQVLLTSPIKGLPFNGTFHSDEGFYYFRNLGNRVLLGGARNKAFEAETTTEMQTSAAIQEELERYLAEVVLAGLGQTYAIEHRWAGIMAFGKEKKPIVKKLFDNLFCAVRMSGMGVALAPVVAEKVVGMMD